jgi:glycosyltransferase involved in cell wall biosynthesis
VRAQLGIQPDAFVVGHAGRFAEVKNHRFLVEIAGRLCKLEPKAVFLLIGDGPLKPRIEELVRSRGLDKHFIFTGIRRDVPRLMKGAMDCFLLPSLYEGLPMVLLEAQAAGLRCVVSDTVSSEGDLGDAVVTHIPLSASPDEWADHLTRGSTKNDFAISEDWLQARSIESSVARLESIYSSAISN